MTTALVTPYRSQVTAGRMSFWHLVHAEWTKFRTVRGWMIAMIVAIMAITAFVFLASNVSSSCSGSACPAPPAGPGGEPVTDAFYFAHQPLTGNGTITVQITSLTGQVATGPSQTTPGLQPWSKAGIIIKQNTSQGSAYAAMMVTGSHGVRMQWDYVNDTPGLGMGAGEAGGVSAASPRWLRLVRDGDMITGYDSADGTHWTLAGTATLPGLTSTVQAGLFAAAPSNDNTATATGVFRHIGLSWTATRWTGTNVGGFGPNGVPQPGTLRQSAGTITVTGSGDITPLAGDGSVLSVQRALVGTPIGLIPLIVVGAMFITVEYRRGLIRVSLTASPSRGRLLAAKAVAIGAVSFVTGLIAAAFGVAVGARILARTGVPLWPVPTLSLARMIVGTGALLAVAAVLALAVGTAARRSGTAVAAAIVVIFVPYLLVLVPPLLPGHVGRGGFAGGGLSLVAREWLLRITPAAGFSVQQVVPQFPQVAGASYSPNWGYYPLAPWAGFAVECAWAVAALALASYLLRRRDA
jgi:ABC-type transport system involved in multi-copper enzyme maturation permease subunit